MSAMTGQMMGVNLFDRFVGLCLQFWPTIVIVAFLSDPAAGGLARLLVKEKAPEVGGAPAPKEAPAA